MTPPAGADKRRPCKIILMVAERHSGYVPASYLDGASCLLPEVVGRDRLIPPLPALAEGGIRRSRPAVEDAFTPAERVVVGLVCEGMSNKEIAAALGRAEPTIKHQLSTAMQKLGVQSRCQLIVRLLRR